MLRKTIFVLAISLSSTPSSWAADGLSAPAALYIGAAGVSASQQDEAKNASAASFSEAADSDASDAGNVDCFYQRYANNPVCFKAPQAQALAADETPSMYQKAGY